MSLIGFEGFDDNNGGFPDELLGGGQTNVNGNGYWLAASGGTSKVAGLLGGSAVSLQSNGQYKCLFTTSYSRIIWGSRIKTFSNFASNPATIVAFLDGTTAQCGLNFNTAGQMIFWHSTASTILATGTTTFAVNSWYYVEIDVTINNTTGAFNVRVNGTGSELSASGVNTRNSANNFLNAFWWYDSNGTNSVVCQYDDLYVLDPTTGSAPYTSMLGVCRIETLFPTANDAVTWTPSASNNFNQVSEVNMDSDTSYNVTATTGQDTFTHGALAGSPTTIYAAAVRAVVRKDQTSNPQAQTTLISGAATAQGTINGQATTYQAMRDFYLTDPNTSAAWTAAAINATKIGYNRTI
jgi:hypothetical protein